MDCLFFIPPGRVELRKPKRPQAAAGEALVEVVYSGVSPGTELRCLSGEQPGTPADGFIPGYQCVGRVMECPDDSIKPGQRVFLNGTARSELPRVWGGHVSLAVAPVDSLYPLANEIDLLQAAFAKLAAISHNGAQIANVQPGEQVAIVGLGPIGFFSAQILTQTGHVVTAFDLSAGRVEAAASVGIKAVQVERARPIHEQVAAHGPPDVIVDSTGVPELLTELLRAGKDLSWGERVERGVRYVVQGSYPGEFSIPYNEAFMKEASLHFPRADWPADVRAALGLMREGKLGLPDKAVDVCHPGEAQPVYDKLQASRNFPLTVAFKWNEEE